MYVSVEIASHVDKRRRTLQCDLKLMYVYVFCKSARKTTRHNRFKDDGELKLDGAFFHDATFYNLMQGLAAEQ